jgi:3-hydroxyisobutyrate dehydrogenase-like beta-hydroxyacid dehydrogenase
MTANGIRVGFIGLGDMGGAIARRIIDAPFPTTLWARRDASFEPFKNTDAKFAASPRELGAASDVVGVCVFKGSDVLEVLCGESGVFSGLRAGGVVLVHSTISVDEISDISQQAALRGINLLDAPVSGARAGAEAGRLAIMVGGDESAFNTARPVMQAYGGTVRLMGPLGSGQKTKVLNNVLGFCNLRMAYLALQIGEKLGLDSEALQTILRSGSASSFNLAMLIDRLLPDPQFARHALTMTVKDTDLYKAVREAANIGPSWLDRLAEEAVTVVSELGESAS